MYILSIESSCDETSMAILDGNKMIKNIVSSQIDFHKEYGGVIPELASRLHVENFPYVIESVLKNIDINKITHVAYTEKPGLIGCLQIGTLVASAIALSLNVPLIPINHIDGHIFAAAITNKITYPALALVASGGHTQLIKLISPVDKTILGETQDDAVGEVYDKVGRKLGLLYPGGPKIDLLSQKGKSSIEFPSPKTKNPLDFSFSGLKSSVINYIYNNKQRNNEININDVCASFQKTAINVLLDRTKLALKLFDYKTLILSGGVSANSLLRKKIMDLHSNTIIPELEYSTDNAAMIAKACQIQILWDKSK